jgi:hypothetical protein
MGDLNRLSRCNHIIVVAGAQLSCEQSKNGAHPFAASVKQIPASHIRDLIGERHVRKKACLYLFKSRLDCGRKSTLVA